MASTSFQLLQLDCHGDPVLQTENINWLLSQHWLQGLIFTPVDEQTASHLVKQIVHQHRHVVAVDAPVEAATVSVTSDNIQGGEKAAALLHARLGNECVVLICGTRNISSINSRIQGFFKQARQYGWKVVEIFASATHPQHAREGVLEGIQLTPEADGIFLANEVATHAYIDLFAEHLLKECTLQAVGFDMTPKIADAIAEGCLLGSIMQDPLQLGGKAAQELLTLLEQPSDTPASSPGKVLIPVQAITRETLSENLFSS